jgi:hypothetical protein
MPGRTIPSRPHRKQLMRMLGRALQRCPGGIISLMPITDEFSAIPRGLPKPSQGVADGRFRCAVSSLSPITTYISSDPLGEENERRIYLMACRS